MTVPAPRSEPADTGLATLRGRLVALVRQALGDVPVSHAAPGAAGEDAEAVSLYLLALEGAASGARQTGLLQFDARFLVAVQGPDVALANERLATLLFAALDTPGLDVAVEPLPQAAWTAFGVPPQPCFTVKAPLQQRRQLVAAPAVREAVVQMAAAGVPLRGRVLGEDDTPVADARIELPAFHSSTRTDANGMFVFPSVPAGRTLNLRVIARGRGAAFDVQAGASDGPPVTLRTRLLQP